MAILMCQDTQVYSTRIKKIINPSLMPCPAAHITDWRNARMFLRGVNRAPEEDERNLGKESVTVKRRLSLSDAYWYKFIKDNEARSFFQLTPYLNEFTEYGVRVSKKSSPSVQLGGSATKIWRLYNNQTVIHKVLLPNQQEAEVRAIGLAQRLGLSVNKIIQAPQAGTTGLFIVNMTTPDTMLMRLHYWDVGAQSQKKVPTNFGYTLKYVTDVYRRLGIHSAFPLTTILFDAVVSNYDRIQNLSNWGYYKSALTGVNSEAPLYDFNLAHITQRNMYIRQVKAWITAEHKTLLRKWQPVVAAYGVAAWTDNINELIAC